ncbi:glycosyl transferase family 1 [Reticulibacter mediterranei]|uniref:Glycosyl transferase family 1 n=1 Tax=Reticulibacter mediterranei TaxID=2778369 RepID=A0A8J3J2D0_9CHLR|nr:glycosyltransferase [Reticulibacter mediterranei]GHP01041.1 glycosyl transferase family 1 [Reticulibacter mediterranei]
MKRSPQLDRYQQYVDKTLLDAIYQKAQALTGLHILHLNTTETGGGVAEILEALTPVTEEFGIEQDRHIIQLDEQSNHFTGRLVDLLQGNLPGDIPEKEKRIFLKKLSETLPHPEECQADIYYVHDFQLAPLAHLYPWMQPALWFCHIDTAHPNPNAENYIRQYLDDYELYTFNTALSVFDNLLPQKTQVVTLGIDPFIEKNAPMEKERGMEVLARLGIDTQRPLITQVSRFDKWKNPWQVIDIYRQAKQQIPQVQVALVGAMEAADDIGASEVLHKLQDYAKGDPDIHFFYDPKQIQGEEVNAFQRFSDVILQRSSREGFGLTVTEAMWKGQPVVGTSVTGLRAQIEDGTNGYISDDTDAATKHTLDLLQDRALKQKLGKQAHEHVREHYLLPMMILSYLDALEKVHQRHKARQQANSPSPVGD